MFVSKELLQQLKIVDCGYTEELTPQSFDHYDEWVKQGHSRPLKYLEDHRKEARVSLKSVLPDAESAVVFLFSYHREKITLTNWLKKIKAPLKMASYIFGFNGGDYHNVVKESLNIIGDELKNQFEGLEYRACLDIHPVLERDLALRSGLGWFGKNSMLISRKYGSFTIIGSLVLNKKLKESSHNEIETDHCGQCRACIDACPTDAILIDKRQIIASRCISTYTIEMFKADAEAPTGMEKASGEIFGCDICQDVCPWNQRPERQGLSGVNEDEFLEANKLITSTFLSQAPEKVIEELDGLSNNSYKKKFKGTPLERTGRVGILKNLNFWKL